MNYRRIIAAALSLCLMAGAAVANTGRDLSTGEVYAADDASENKLTIEYVGQTLPIAFSGNIGEIKWYSDDETIASVTPVDALSAEITGKGKGTTSVYAVLPDRIVRFDVTVLSDSSQPAETVKIGEFTLTSQQNSATINLNGINNEDAVWSSSDEKVAAVDSKGVVTAVGKGKCIITAAYDGVEYFVEVTSEYEPKEDPGAEPVCLGKIQLDDKTPVKKISGIDLSAGIKLNSSDEKVAVVAEDGTVTAVASGSCRIYLESGDQKCYYDVESTYTGKNGDGTDLGTVSLTADSPSQKMTLKNIPAGTVVEWSSSDNSIAYVTDSGVMIAVNDGSCVITAKAGDKEYHITAQVSGADSVSTTEIRGIGRKLNYEADPAAGAMTFRSSDTSVISVDEKGVITTVGVGTALMIAESERGISYMRIRVLPAYFPGDANCDGEVGIADATAILQHIGNKDIYCLSEQGEINADVDGKTGISAMDSLCIQMFDAKMINSLPATPEQITG